MIRAGQGMVIEERMNAGWLRDLGRQGMVIEERMKAGWLCDQGRA